MKTFDQYNNENPEIWKLFRDTTLDAIRKGFRNYSSKSIFEIIRWHRSGEIKEDSFKINNNYTADYARLFTKTFPEYEGFFRTRKIKQRN